MARRGRPIPAIRGTATRASRGPQRQANRANSCPISGRNLHRPGSGARSVACRPRCPTRTWSPASPPAPGLTEAEAARVVEDVVAFHAEPVEDYVRRRHAAPEDLRREEPRDLRPDRRGAGRRVVAAPDLTERQLRRHDLRLGRAHAQDEGHQNDVRNRRLRRQPAGRAAAPRGPGRLEHRGYDSAGRRRARQHRDQGRQAGRPGARPGRAAAEAVRRQGRHRPHPLGDPRPGQRRQRAPAHRRQGPGRGRAQRDHRQRRGAAAAAGRRRRRAGRATPTPRCSPTWSRRSEADTLEGKVARGARPRSRAPTASPCCTPTSPTGSWSPATAAR